MTVTVALPSCVGVPLISPDDEMEMPSGALSSEYVYGDLPPDTDTWIGVMSRYQVTTTSDMSSIVSGVTTVTVNDSSSVFDSSSESLAVTVTACVPAVDGAVPVMLPPDATVTHDEPLFFEKLIVPHPPVPLAESESDPPVVTHRSAMDAMDTGGQPTVIMKSSKAVFIFVSVAFTSTVGLLPAADADAVPPMLPVLGFSVTHAGQSPCFEYVNGPQSPVAVAVRDKDPPTANVTSSISAMSIRQGTVISYEPTPLHRQSSLASTSTVNLPVSVGVPVISPSDDTVTHDGPLFFSNIYGDCPPDAVA